MRLAALIHFSMPFRCAGSETVAHELFRAAVEAGHEVTVFCTNKDAMHSWRGNEPDVMLDGVRIVRVRNSLIGAQRMKAWKPDAVFSHHQHVMQAIKTARLIGARSIFATHNDYALNKRPLQAKPNLVIHNSAHVARTLNANYGEPPDWFLFHPPLTQDRHLVPSTGDGLTLINVNAHKGSRFLYRLAEVMPDRHFVAVIGGHGEQVIKRNLKNVTVLPHSPDMKRVWSVTGTLLMPSLYESYGLTAVEAGINGIPTIANATPGLMENIGSGGSFVDWGDRNLPTPMKEGENEKMWLKEWDNPSDAHVAEWVEAIEKMDSNYTEASQYARGRAETAMADTQEALNQWVEWLAV
jgi:glycosyltransferase involved in cell wall biosynthesis